MANYFFISQESQFKLIFRNESTILNKNSEIFQWYPLEKLFDELRKKTIVIEALRLYKRSW